jgi:hypothetical protein
MEKNIARLHGTRFSLPTMEARLRAQTAHFSPGGATHFDRILTGGGDDDVARAEDGRSDDESNDLGDDSETEHS